MATDHSRSYKGFGIRAIGHRHRLKAIFGELKKLGLSSRESFCDLGCSNGYITNMIHRNFNFSLSLGLDHEADNLSVARLLYPDVKFDLVDLNCAPSIVSTFDLVTCFETLEHVGNLDHAIENILSRIAPGGRSLISVPIEHGPKGLFKYLIKKMLRYTVSELGISEINYFKILISGGRLSKARPKADGYGTHFGFDYRDVDDLLTEKNAEFKAYNKGISRFYIIRRL